MLLDFEDGALVRRWLHGPEVDEPLAYERYAGTTAGGSGTALELFRNRLGSVILAVSVSTGAVAAEYDYDSFGQRTLVQGTEEVRYGFTSREHDARTGLIHYRAREHDPLTGRFLQRDPIGFASGDLNLYAYVENDPYNWTDPSGEISGQYGNLARQSAQMVRGAVATVGRGVIGLANRIAMSLRGIGPRSGNIARPASDDVVTGGSAARSSANAERLREFFRQLEKYGSGGHRTLGDGRVRFYGNLRPSNRSGQMGGSRTVREWNPANGRTRTWHETIDDVGRVRIVRPQLPGRHTHYMFDDVGNFIGTF